jgi:glycyl-tRNA synthetase (class II)
MSLAEDAKPTMDLMVHKQECPLCKGPAEFVPCKGKGGQYKRFFCKKCKAFVMSLDTEKDILKSRQKDKDELSKQSSACNDDTILHICSVTELISIEPLIERKTIKRCPEPKSNWL